MICFRCHKTILIGEHYYAITEHNNKLKIKTDFVHKECWDKFLKQISDTTEAMSIVRGLKSKLTSVGFLPKDEVIIQ